VDVRSSWQLTLSIYQFLGHFSVYLSKQDNYFVLVLNLYYSKLSNEILVNNVPPLGTFLDLPLPFLLQLASKSGSSI
jgi:hypothetical protein